MSTSQKICLNWGYFQNNLNASFGSLKVNKEFSDVTLVCGQGKQVEAHKVILAASSPFFPEYSEDQHTSTSNDLHERGEGRRTHSFI